ncbi:putative 2-aminoethylphosphonate ABC transporter permease subunit [Sulfurospirillum cavolei]|uniref:putative 2-aminoethylphosphonate ABC transporter permease subunit n=1 Tax=Sulfurospirillum cavolei TaxID=366522 RepID=UPI000764C117|nr:putative 2-aminoethylphosphonate ABC transporter permease subunit [Sulfurospirillum cavolei]
MRSVWEDSNRLVLSALTLLLTLGLCVMILAPLVQILAQSFFDATHRFVFLDNFIDYLSQEKSLRLIRNSLFVALTSTLIVVPSAFGFAYALMRSRMPLKPFFRYVAFLPLLAPSLLPAISFVYLFGHQGFFKPWMGGSTIYGAWGIVLGECFYVFPHIVMIFLSALSLSDARLYEAAQSMGASSLKKFFTITLPALKYALVSATLVSFTLVVTDFGVPKVIGGDFNVLATEIYKHVIGQQNFALGATVGVLLLVPSVVTFIVDSFVQRKQKAVLGSKFVLYVPQKAPIFDTAMLIFALVIALFFLIVLGVSFFASFVKFWPYDLSLVLKHYDFSSMDGGGWDSYFNSLSLAFWSALLGTIAVFTTAYVVERGKVFPHLRAFLKLLALLPMAVPGLVLGLGYIFFFNHPDNPLNALYQTMGILVVCTVAHFFTASFITATTTIKQIDDEFEDVAESMGVACYETFFKVIVPIATPSILHIARYFFVNAMTTVSAVVFLYAPSTTLASVAVLNMDDAGDISSAAAMASVIVATSLVITLAFDMLSHVALKQSQQWRKAR